MSRTLDARTVRSIARDTTMAPAGVEVGRTASDVPSGTCQGVGRANLSPGNPVKNLGYRGHRAQVSVDSDGAMWKPLRTLIR